MEERIEKETSVLGGTENTINDKGPNNFASGRQGEGITLNFRDFLDVLLERWWIILLVIGIVTAGLYYRDRKNYVPMYSSSAVIHLSVLDVDSENVSFALGLSSNLIPDCQYCLSNRTTIEKAYEALAPYGISYGEIAGSISAENPEKTRYINVSVVANSPEKSMMIVNAVCEACKAQMKVAAHDYDVVQIESPGKEGSLCNSVNFFDSFRVGIISGVAVYAIFLVIRLFDDRFRDEADIEWTLGTTILGTVPNANSSSTVYGKKLFGKKRYGYGYGSSYGYGYGYGFGKYGATQAVQKKAAAKKAKNTKNTKTTEDK